MTPVRRSRSTRRVSFALLVVGLLLGACDASSSPAPSASAAATAPAGPTGGPVDGGGGGGAASPGPVGPGPASSSAAPSEGPGPSASTPAGPSGGPPRTPFGAVSKGLKGEVFAFVTIDQVADATAGLDWDATSTVVFFSLAAAADGHLLHDSRWRVWTSAPADALIARAHATGTKVVFSLSRFSWSAAQTKDSTALLASAGARQRLADAVADEVARRGVDGVNVDFEPIPRGQKANFTDLIRRIRVALDARGPGSQLTFDVLGHFESYDVGGALSAGADAVYLMGYHYAGTFSTIAHATAPLDGPRYSVGDAIAGLRKVARPDQIIAGVPYYGHIWPTASGAHNAKTTGKGGDVTYREARLVAQRHPPTYDPAEAVQWSAWKVRDCASCPLHWVQLYYDDARSLRTKWSAFERGGLRGTGFWTWGFQGDSGELAAALRSVWLAP